jgi:glyoxylase-like metal-dependent hydrolase (beta-lactamase superfamily II)
MLFMPIHFLNGFSKSLPWPPYRRIGAVCLLAETNQGLLLVDTGLGLHDYEKPTHMMRDFMNVLRAERDPDQTIVRQVARMGYSPEDVHHIVQTHLHLDHAGGLPDFPWAKVHVHRKEYEAFTGRRRHWSQLAYVPRHIAHGLDWAFHENTGEKWFDFDAIRLPFEPEMWLLPLPGHTRGLCGVVIRTLDGWLLQTSDAAALFNEEAPGWIIRLVMGPHQPRIRKFAAAHPDVRVVAGHAWLGWFSDHKEIA